MTPTSPDPVLPKAVVLDITEDAAWLTRWSGGNYYRLWLGMVRDAKHEVADRAYDAEFDRGRRSA